MAVTSRPDDVVPADESTVRSHETCPGRTVFTESGNRDGWIATDLTVELRR